MTKYSNESRRVAGGYLLEQRSSFYWFIESTVANTLLHSTFEPFEKAGSYSMKHVLYEIGNRKFESAIIYITEHYFDCLNQSANQYYRLYLVQLNQSVVWSCVLCFAAGKNQHSWKGFFGDANEIIFF